MYIYVPINVLFLQAVSEQLCFYRYTEKEEFTEVFLGLTVHKIDILNNHGR